MEKSNGNFLATLLQLDKSISLSLSVADSKTSQFGHLRPHMKLLEYSCHGAFWIPATIIGIWFSSNPRKEAFFFNLILALISDIIIVACLKAAIGRNRPENNKADDMFLTLSVDKMSCPSGHTTRAVLLTFIFISSTPNSYLLHPFFTLWCVCTCLSRVALGRHHLGDVLLGAVVGYLEYCIMDYIWASPETSSWYLGIFRDSGNFVDDL